MKIRLLELERELTVSKTTTTLLEDKKYRPLEQLKAIKEENALLKKYLNSPMEPSHPKQKNRMTLPPPSYASVADAIANEQDHAILHQSGNHSTEPDWSHSAPVPPPKPLKYPLSVEFFPYKVLFFKGCHKKTIGEYKECFLKLVSRPTFARHFDLPHWRYIPKWSLLTPKPKNSLEHLNPFPTRSATCPTLTHLLVPIWDLRWIHWRFSIKSYLALMNKLPTSWPAK